MASGTHDGIVQLWDPATGDAVSPPLPAHDGWVAAVALASLPGGRTVLASAGRDAVVRVFDLA